ncbi:MAG: alpha/beta hydrolase, partial [Hyphomicrobiaceae bacterium]
PSPPKPAESKPAEPSTGRIGGGSPSGGSGKPAADGSIVKSLPPVVNSAPASSASDAKPNVCVDANVCTIVDVFFGTDRKQTEVPGRIGFGGDRAGKLQLGHAFVTVPKAQRVKGAIPLPSLWDRWVRGVPPEGDPARHFTIPKNGVTVYATEADFLAAAKNHIAGAGDFKDHAFIFVHGFYVTFDNALYRTAQISYDLSPDGKPFGTAFLYSWPSAGDATSYLYDQDSANFASLHLQNFIKTVVDKTGVKNVHIIAHSMGNVALIGALQELARTDSKTKINQIILAAPDVDKQQFETIIQSVEKVAKGITLYASQGDNALALARKARRGLPRAGETLVPPGPAVVTGVDTIDVSAINTDVWSWGHDTYADSRELLTDINTIFIKGLPPAKRSPKLKFGLLKYWIYNK